MYSFSSRVRYSEVDRFKHLNLASFIDYFQDCSTFHGEDMNRGMDFLQKNNRVWLLNSWQICVNCYPTLGEEITIETWPYDFKSMYGYRNFLLKNKNGQVLAAANSIWVYYDTKNQVPTKITDYDMKGYELEPSYKMNYAPRKIAIPDGLISNDSFFVTKRNIDTNNHVNNGEYVKMAMEYLPSDFIVSSLRAEYRISAVLDDEITPKLHITDNVVTVVLSNTDNKPFAIIEFTK